MQILDIYMPVFFSSSGNVCLKRILNSGQWKRIFWLVENILFQYLKYPFHWKQFFHLLEIYFKRIIYYRQWQWIFCLVERIFFYSYFFETIIAIRRGQYLLKKILFLLEETVFFNFFFQILSRIEVAFRSSKITFSRNPSLWLMETDFRLITNFGLLFKAVFCWWAQCLKLGVNQFSSDFLIPNSGNSFSGEWKRIFWLVETFSFVQSFSSKQKPSLILVEANS